MCLSWKCPEGSNVGKETQANGKIQEPWWAFEKYKTRLSARLASVGGGAWKCVGKFTLERENIYETLGNICYQLYTFSPETKRSIRLSKMK